MGIFDLFRMPDINQGLKSYMSSPGAVLLDVRTPGEYRGGHIPGSKNVPLQAIDKMTDIVENRDTALFAECKWTNEKVDVGVLDTLVHRSRLFAYQNVQLYLFAKSGFTAGCEARARELGNVSLVTYQDILDAM